MDGWMIKWVSKWTVWRTNVGNTSKNKIQHITRSQQITVYKALCNFLPYLFLIILWGRNGKQMASPHHSTDERSGWLLKVTDLVRVRVRTRTQVAWVIPESSLQWLSTCYEKENYEVTGVSFSFRTFFPPYINVLRALSCHLPPRAQQHRAREEPPTLKGPLQVSSENQIHNSENILRDLCV